MVAVTTRTLPRADLNRPGRGPTAHCGGTGHLGEERGPGQYNGPGVYTPGPPFRALARESALTHLSSYDRNTLPAPGILERITTTVPQEHAR